MSSKAVAWSSLFSVTTQSGEATSLTVFSDGEAPFSIKRYESVLIAIRSPEVLRRELELCKKPLNHLEQPGGEGRLRRLQPLCKFSANFLQESLGGFDTSEFVQHAAFVFDPNIATVTSVEHDLHHLLIVGLCFVAFGVKIM